MGVTMAANPTFELGIVMAGAISAGAYSAGVMDFLIEALDAYEDAKKDPGWDGPTHDVRVPVLSGASAGGMTAAIAALHAFHDLEHVWPDTKLSSEVANRLYSSWVTDISIEELLAVTDLDTDLKRKKGLKSALCCDVLERIVESAFKLKGTAHARNWIGRGDDHSLRLFLTVTNLRGVPYSFSVFGTDTAFRYGMLNHGDYLEFAIGEGPTRSGGSHALNIHDTNGGDWDLFRSAVLATGAFPVGLAPRAISRTPSDYKNGARVGFEDRLIGFRSIPPDDSIMAEDLYAFVSVDGGVVDNEPLEIARRYLAGEGNRNPREGERADKAMLLIDPFQNVQNIPDVDLRDRIINVLPRLFSSLINQARFKPDELGLAESDKVFSRFMIAPVRPGDNNPDAKTYPIASGALGGFSGFLHQSFRRHDYLLGRRNAQAFLRWNFALPETNPLFNGYKESDKWQGRDQWHVRDTERETRSIGMAADRDLPKKLFAKSVGGPKDTFGFPIIPLVPRLTHPIDIGAQDLPMPGNINLDDLRRRVRKRIEKVVSVLVDVDLLADSSELFGGIYRFGARRFGTMIATNKANSAVEEAIAKVARAFGQPRP